MLPGTSQVNKPPNDTRYVYSGIVGIPSTGGRTGGHGQQYATLLVLVGRCSTDDKTPRRVMLCSGPLRWAKKNLENNRLRSLVVVVREVREGGARPRSLSRRYVLRPRAFVCYNNNS